MRAAATHLCRLAAKWLVHGHWPALAELIGWLCLGALVAGTLAGAVARYLELS